MEEAMRTQRMHSIIAVLFLFFLVGLAISASADSIKIAVATTGPENTAPISKLAGRSPYFLFFDGKGNLLKAVENPSKDLSGGAGQGAASLIAKEGATIVIAGDIGHKMEQALRQYQIEIREKTGVAYDVVQGIIQNR